MIIKGQETFIYENYDIVFDYKIQPGEEVISFVGMKKKSQRKFRGVEEFYNEVNNIKVKEKTFNDLFDQFYSNKKSDEEIIKERQRREEIVREFTGLSTFQLDALVKDTLQEKALNVIGNIK